MISNLKKRYGEILKNSLAGKAIKGSIYILLSYFIGFILRLTSNLIVTRILDPQIFGIMALVYVFLMGIGMFSDLGIGVSIIQNKSGDNEEFLDTAWIIQIVRGIIIFIFSCLLAYPFSLFYQEKQLILLIPAVSISSIFSGFIPTKQFSAQRHMEIGWVVLAETITQFFSVLFTILFAWLLKNIWSLVLGNIVASFLGLIIKAIVIPGRKNQRRYNREFASDIIKFGKWIFLNTSLFFITNQGDKLILGKLLSKTYLGIYSIAIFIISALDEIFSKLISKIVYPVFSRMNNSDESSLSRNFYKVRKPIEWFVCTIGGILFTFGNSIITILYDERYSDAGWMLQILSIRFIFGQLNQVSNNLLTAVGKPKYNTVLQTIQSLLLFTTLPLFNHIWGIRGVISAISLNFIINYPIVQFFLYKEGITKIKKEFHVLLPFICGLLIGVALTFIYSHTNLHIIFS